MHHPTDRIAHTTAFVTPVRDDDKGSFHKAILATIDLNYLRLILRLSALIFTSVPRNNFMTIVSPAHVEIVFSVYLTG